VAQDLLEGGQTTTCLKPSASVRVPQLVDMKSFEAGELLDHPVERSVRREWANPAHPVFDLLQDVRRERHASHLAALGLADHER
jgi:hypothetical protein